MQRASGTIDLDPDIKRLLCPHCWDTTFSTKTFSAMWEESAEGARLSNQPDSREAFYKSSLTYRTPPWSQILASAEAFCGYCTLLRDTARKALAAEPSANKILVVTVLFDLASALQRIKITIWTDVGSYSSLTPYNTSIYAEPGDPASRYITSRNVAWKVDDTATYELALECVDNCSRHERCPLPAPSILPTRVLDCADPSRLRLVTSNASMREFYAILSYVWGGLQPHRTTTKNIKAYGDCIDSAKIPKTISDAITVTRRLGLRYLWVDSYCIIQDSDEDKTHELARMRLNFRNAFITIVAARANAVSEGFLQNVFPSLHFQPIRLPFRCPDRAVGIVTVVRHAELLEPIDKRAWCLEERVLSPRLLMFCTLGLQYECQTGRVNVNGSPLGLPRTVPRLPDHAFAAEPGRDAEWQLDMSWDMILQRYTTSNLTKEQDKLIALAGVAEQLHRLWPESRYVAGLWTHQLPSALLWHQHERRVRPKVYTAPSWSWAAVDGRVSPRGITGNPDAWRSTSNAPRGSATICEVKDVVVNTKHSDHPYGEVTSASLVLSADLVRATWNTRLDSEPLAILPDGPPGHGLLIIGRRGLDNHVGYVGLDALDDDLIELPVVEVTLVGVEKASGRHLSCG